MVAVRVGLIHWMIHWTVTGFWLFFGLPSRLNDARYTGEYNIIESNTLQGAVNTVSPDVRSRLKQFQ